MENQSSYEEELPSRVEAITFRRYLINVVSGSTKIEADSERKDDIIDKTHACISFVSMNKPVSEVCSLNAGLDGSPIRKNNR
jgi:hypothetical protein